MTRSKLLALCSVVAFFTLHSCFDNNKKVPQTEKKCPTIVSIELHQDLEDNNQKIERGYIDYVFQSQISDSIVLFGNKRFTLENYQIIHDNSIPQNKIRHYIEKSGGRSLREIIYLANEFLSTDSFFIVYTNQSCKVTLSDKFKLHLYLNDKPVDYNDSVSLNVSVPMPPIKSIKKSR